jgi:hypothetical protein
MMVSRNANGASITTLLQGQRETVLSSYANILKKSIFARKGNGSSASAVPTLALFYPVQYRYHCGRSVDDFHYLTLLCGG